MFTQMILRKISESFIASLSQELEVMSYLWICEIKEMRANNSMIVIVPVGACPHISNVCIFSSALDISIPSVKNLLSPLPTLFVEAQVRDIWVQVVPTIIVL